MAIPAIAVITERKLLAKRVLRYLYKPALTNELVTDEYSPDVPSPNLNTKVTRVLAYKHSSLNR